MANVDELRRFTGKVRAVFAIELDEPHWEPTPIQTIVIVLDDRHLVIEARDDSVHALVVMGLAFARPGRTVHDVGGVPPWNGCLGRGTQAAWTMHNTVHENGVQLMLGRNLDDRLLVQLTALGSILRLAVVTERELQVIVPRPGPTATQLVDAIAATPDDDAPRLVWADSIGGERGEFVVLQCDLARGEAGARPQRERELLAARGAEWAALDGLAAAWEFRRGFVDAIEVDARTFAERGNDVVRAAPFARSLALVGLTGTAERDGSRFGPDAPVLVERVLAAPAFARFDRLAIIAARDRGYGAGDHVDRGDETARVLAASEHLARLRGLAIEWSGLGVAGAHALVASNQLRGLEQLWLHDPEDRLGTDAMLALLAACPALRSLALAGHLDTVAARLPALHELRLHGATEFTLADAARGAAASVQQLGFAGILDRGRALEAFPQLASLDLVETLAATPERAAAFASLQLPALRHLRIRGDVAVDVLVAIARAFGPQLEVLDVDGTSARYKPLATLRDRLQEHVAGEVVLGTDGPHRRRFL